MFKTTQPNKTKPNALPPSKYINIQELLEFFLMCVYKMFLQITHCIEELCKTAVLYFITIIHFVPSSVDSIGFVLTSVWQIF